MKVVMCGKFGAGVVVFDGWLWRKSLLVLRKLICSWYEGVKRHGSLQWAVVNCLN